MGPLGVPMFCKEGGPRLTQGPPHARAARPAPSRSGPWPWLGLGLFRKVVTFPFQPTSCEELHPPVNTLCIKPSQFTEVGDEFLGLANYYRRFIKGYSAKAAPLTDLLKKGKTWEWSKRCQTAFEGLKGAVTEEPVLALPDHTKVFEVQTDASDFAIGGVLIQEGHPIAFESRKLNDTERRYTVQEKEMTAVVHCLRTWRHYLLGSRFLIKTDNIATSYFQSQKKLSPKQARWQDFLAEFDYVMEYKPGKANLVADALSRKAELAAMSKAKGDILEGIKEGMEHDPLARQLFKLAESGQTQRFWVEDGLLHERPTGVCSQVEQLEEEDHSRVSRHSVGRPSGATTDICLGGGVILLAPNEGRSGGVREDLSCVPTRQGGEPIASGTTRAFAHPRTSVGECKHGLHYMLAKIGGMWLDYGCGGPVFQVLNFYSIPSRLHSGGSSSVIFEERGEVLGTTEGYSKRPRPKVYGEILDRIVQTPWLGAALLNELSPSD
ncbi:hypothetical protein RJ640_002395 [Escallonia rubra]|uniref:Reverse transcriptase/retrotransposon-derived protein RNase H-like domain-containing protein n=1 Tax=Escallonia rubra TaxID=112253 RepID=A0AA88UHX1_9ASTE|nr:hypothetical protein RJ640_002395 [Escallonia rubra]